MKSLIVFLSLLLSSHAFACSDYDVNELFQKGISFNLKKEYPNVTKFTSAPWPRSVDTDTVVRHYTIEVDGKKLSGLAWINISTCSFSLRPPLADEEFEISQ